MKYSKLSFIIPCYNCADTIIESLDSVYNQEFDIPFEVICTDDGSTDGTIDMLLEYSDKHSNLRVMGHAHNKGGASASNTSVRKSSGDLLFRLDSDNVLIKNSVNDLVRLMVDTNCEAASFSNVNYFNVPYITTHTWEYGNTRGICDLGHVITNHRVPPSSGNYLYTRNSYLVARGYPESAGAMDSWGFGFKQLASGTKIALLPNSFYYHRVRQQGYWNREERRGKNSINACNIVREYDLMFKENSQKWLMSKEAETNFFGGIASGKLVLQTP